VKKYTVPKEYTGTRNITLHIAETASSSKVYIDDEPIKKWMNGYRYDDDEGNSCFLMLEQELNGTVYVRINGELAHIAGKHKSVWLTKFIPAIERFLGLLPVSRSPTQEQRTDTNEGSDENEEQDGPYPLFMVIGMGLGWPLGREAGGTFGATVGLVLGGGLGHAIDTSLKNWRSSKRIDKDGLVESDSPRSRSRTFAIVSLFLGLLSIIIAELTGPLAIPFAIFGLVFGLLHLTRRRKSRNLAFIGIILSIGALGIAIHSMYQTIVNPITHAYILQEMGYDQATIENPIDVQHFLQVDRASVTPLWGSAITFGWYNTQEEVVILEVDLETSLISGEREYHPFAPGDSSFGFFIQVNEMIGGGGKWFSDPNRNDSEHHIMTFPTIENGSVVKDSYILFWEGWPLDTPPLNLIDYADLVVRVDGVKLVRLAAE